MISPPPVDIHFTDRLPGPAEALVVGIWEGGILSASAQALGIETWIRQVLAATPAFTGKSGNVLALHAPALPGAAALPGVAASPASAPGAGVLAAVAPRWLLLAGLGAYGHMDGETARRCGAETGAALQLRGIATAAIDLDVAGDEAASFALGLRLRVWQSPALRQPEPEETPRLRLVSIRTREPRQAGQGWQVLEALAGGVELARSLTALPGNRLTPAQMVAHARALELPGVSVEILDVPRMQAEGLHLHLAVGAGSACPPALAVLRWRGASAEEAPVLLVGKGLTFDSGGLCLKPAAHMEEMTEDMAGAAAVLGTLRAVAEAGLDVNVTGLLALAENMPGGQALRPGDILASHHGRTVEVIDTDAEGRLVLADALSWGCQREKPRAVIDLATLTGSIVVALGHHHAGLFSGDDRLARTLMRAGLAMDEPLWRMPLPVEAEGLSVLDEALKSEAADLRQCAPAGRLLPDALHAARFLSLFVPAEIPWAHLDIAGVCRRSEAWAHSPKGVSGFGVMTLFEWLRQS